jgi:hypothetical protein
VELGFGPKDRVILFGGLVRRHKGISSWRSLSGSWGHPTACWSSAAAKRPDLRALTAQQRKAMVVLPPQNPERMAALNAAADIVVLWLDRRSQPRIFSRLIK